MLLDIAHGFNRGYRRLTALNRFNGLHLHIAL